MQKLCCCQLVLIMSTRLQTMQIMPVHPCNVSTSSTNKEFNKLTGCSHLDATSVVLHLAAYTQKHDTHMHTRHTSVQLSVNWNAATVSLGGVHQGLGAADVCFGLLSEM